MTEKARKQCEIILAIKTKGLINGKEITQRNQRKLTKIVDA